MCRKVIEAMRKQRWSISPDMRQIIIKTLANTHTVIYTADNGPGQFVACCFQRKGLKPKFAYRFSSAEKREAFIRKWVAEEVAYEERKKADRKKRVSGHNLEIGDVLNTSWGYDQTNVDYFQVVGLKGKATVKLREISAIQHDDSHVLPNVDSFVGEVFEKRVNGNYNSVKISSCQTATPVSKDDNGNYKPSYKTPWGMGH